MTAFALQRAGGAAVAITPETPAVAWDTIDGVVLGGGDDVDPARYAEGARAEARIDPARDALEWEAIERAIERELPILAICRGAQLLNVFHGGTLHQDLRDAFAEHSPRIQLFAVKRVEVARGSRLHQALGVDTLRVNSMHRQGIARIGRGLVASAHDTLGIVQGVERPHGPFAVGVQWHPELLPGRAAQRRLFAALVRAAARASSHAPAGAR
jgi:putative glutamine amidotransferase